MVVSAITGLGAVTALGETAPRSWAALERGDNGIRRVTRFDTTELASSLGATVEGPLGESSNRALEYALAAAHEALADAGIGADRQRVALVLGTSLGSSRTDLAALAGVIAETLELGGPRIVISTACSSSTHATGLARDLLRAGDADVVLAGGTDELTPELFAGFCALGVVSRERCAPFSEPVGTSLGEGAGFVVLEGARRAADRDKDPRAWIRGYGLSADAHHATSPDPTGAGVRRAISGALLDAQVSPRSVEYVNAHGTGTAANDPAEARAIAAAVGLDGHAPWISSSKSFLGHAQGAAGILELIVTILGMEKGRMPCTMGFSGPRPRCPADPVAARAPRRQPYSCALSLNSAFGGANAAVVVARGDTAPDSSPRSKRRVLVAGASLVGPGGATLADAADTRSPLRGAAPDIAIQRVVRGADPRGVDRATAMLAAAVKQAVDVSKLDLGHDRRDRIGLFVGQTRVAVEAEIEFDRSIRARGLARLSAPAFAKMVLNAAAGAVTRMLGLRGPMTAVCTGPSTGLAAIALAADYLRFRSDVDTIIAAGLTELEDDGSRLAEGACAVVLTTAAEAAPWAEVRSWALAGPVGPEALRRQALERAAAGDDGTIHCVHPAEVACDDGGLGGALACAVASERARRRHHRQLLALDARGSTNVAVLLSRVDPTAGGAA